MRALTRTTLAALTALLFARASSAQVPDAWVKLAPEGERFVALMPAQPATQSVRIEAGKLKIAGRSYVATGDDKAVYTILAFNDPYSDGERLVAANRSYTNEQSRGPAIYLDEVAEIAWEALIKPEAERLKAENVRDFLPYMAYRREFELDGYAAREYSVKLQKAGGLVYLCNDGSRIYVVAAVGPDQESPRLKRFVESFKPEARPTIRIDPKLLPGSGTGTGTGMGPGRGGNVGGGDRDTGGGGEIDYTRPFLTRDVTQKAVLTYRAEPGYTEGGRKFNVTGVVRIRAVLNRTGEVTNISVIKGLPHGLTVMALDAARRVKFKPAQKDGRDVSQYITFEYNFNIY